MTTFNQGLIEEIFGEQPRLALLGQAANQNRGRSFEDFFARNSSRFLDRFQAFMGSQLAQGRLPTTTAQDFFSPEFLMEEFFRAGPGQRGEVATPRVRFLRGR